MLVYLLLRCISYLSGWKGSFNRLFTAIRAVLWSALDMMDVLKCCQGEGVRMRAAPEQSYLPGFESLFLRGSMGQHTARAAPGKWKRRAGTGGKAMGQQAGKQWDSKRESNGTAGGKIMGQHNQESYGTAGGKVIGQHNRGILKREMMPNFG